MGGDRSDRIYRILMSLDLSDMMEDLFAAEDSQVNARGGSIITLIDKKAAREIACQAHEVSKKRLTRITRRSLTRLGSKQGSDKASLSRKSALVKRIKKN